MNKSRKSRKTAKELALRTLLSFAGVVLLAFGIFFFTVGDAGLDPYTALNTAVSDRLNMSLGVYQLIPNFVIIGMVFFLDRKLIGIGTVINMVLTGFLIDGFTFVYEAVFQFEITSAVQVLYLILGLIFFTLGVSMYKSPDLGVAPYDAITPVLSERVALSYKYCRIIQDSAVVAIAYFLGGPIGIITVVSAFFTGPLIVYWDDHFSKRLVEGIVAVSS